MCKNRVTKLSWAATGQLSRLFTAQRHLVKGQSKGLTCSTAKLGSVSGLETPREQSTFSELQEVTVTCQDMTNRLCPLWWRFSEIVWKLYTGLRKTPPLSHSITIPPLQPPKFSLLASLLYKVNHQKRAKLYSQSFSWMFLWLSNTLSRVRLCGPMDSSPPGPSVHVILQVRILEWVAISFCRGSSRPRD